MLVALAAKYGWQSAFYSTGIPGIVSAALIWFLIDELPADPHARQADGSVSGWWSAVRELLKVRNVTVCDIMGIVPLAALYYTGSA